MRGGDEICGSLFSYRGLETRVRADHLLRVLRVIAKVALAALSGAFEQLYSPIGRGSIPPERLRRALLLQAFYRPKDGSGDPPGAGRNGEQRKNDTDASTTDPDARSVRNGPGKEARLSFMGHALMANRNGRVVGAVTTRAAGHAERLAALALIKPYADRPRPVTLGADKGYDSSDFVMDLREQAVTPHRAQSHNGRRSTIVTPLAKL
jgi:hypothetical protein